MPRFGPSTGLGQGARASSKPTPKDILGAKCGTWLNADLGLTLQGVVFNNGIPDFTAATVSAWADQSGNARHFQQPTAASQPKYAPIVAEMGGLAAVRFLAASQHWLELLSTAGNIGGNDADYLIVASLVPRANPSNQHSWYSNRGMDHDPSTGGIQPWNHASIAAETEIYLGFNACGATGGVPFSYFNSAPQANNPGPSIGIASTVHAFRASGGTTRHYVNSVTPRAAVSHATTARVTIGRLGWDQGAANYLNADIREIVIARGSLSDLVVAELIRNMAETAKAILV